MKKYFTIINIFWQRALTYRFTVFSYRIGEILEMLILILMWSNIYKNTPIIGGLNYREMITYVLVGNLFRVMVRNFLSDMIARNIRYGEMSVFLLRPMGYFTFMFFKEVGRISIATLMSLFSQLFILSFFWQIFLTNTNPLILFIIFLIIILAFLTEFLIAYIIGLLAFWFDEVDGLYATIDRLKTFFSGGYFPLSLLPGYFVSLSFFLPFSYTFYIPAQLYLNKLDISLGIKGLLIQLVWIGILTMATKIVWHFGLKKYEGVGI